MTLTPDEAFVEASALLNRLPVFGAGSLFSAMVYDVQDGYHDLDLFVPTQQVLISTIQLLQTQGYTFDDRFDRVWQRWLRYGLKGWHTNSMRMHSPDGVETNIVFKMVDGHPTTSLSQVLESFDFGLLGVGYDFESQQFRDMRSFLFPHLNPEGPLPLMPNKRSNWLNGFISQYNGLREAGRYAKYHGYGYDLSMVKADLVRGYRMVSLYHNASFDDDKQLLAKIYERLADAIEGDEIDELTQSYKQLDFKDPLTEIMEALE